MGRVLCLDPGRLLRLARHGVRRARMPPVLAKPATARSQLPGRTATRCTATASTAFWSNWPSGAWASATWFANLNFFSKAVVTDEVGASALRAPHTGAAGQFVDLRFEMDVLVVLSAAPHPLDPSIPSTAPGPVRITAWRSGTAGADDHLPSSTAPRTTAAWDQHRNASTPCEDSHVMRKHRSAAGLKADAAASSAPPTARSIRPMPCDWCRPARPWAGTHRAPRPDAAHRRPGRQPGGRHLVLQRRRPTATATA